MAQQRNAISALGTQIRQEKNGLRQELKQDISKLEQRIGELRREAKQDRQDIARDLKVLGECTARIQGAVTGHVWDDGMMGEAEAVSRPVVSPRPEAEA